MRSSILILMATVLSALTSVAQRAVVADSLTRQPLANASILDRSGNPVGMTGLTGSLPYISDASFPITVRYLGYAEKTVSQATADTIFLTESVAELPEVLVSSRQHKVLHMLAYVREYSTLTSYTETVFLFREKMVDFMLTPDRKARIRGWNTPRVLTSKSYYRFTNSEGLDSVSDESNYHFSWSDWIGVPPSAALPAALRNSEMATDTLRGRYSPSETWTKSDYRVNVDLDVLADTTSRKWVPNLGGFFRRELDFESFRLRLNYDNILADSVEAQDLTGYSFNIESRGRGRGMFRFNHVDQPFFVSTYAEVYMLDKEFITVKEARKWEGLRFNFAETGILGSEKAPPLQASVLELMARVENIDKEGVRLDVVPDERLAGRYAGKGDFSFGARFLTILKQLTGISTLRAHRNMNKSWKKIRKEQLAKKPSAIIRATDDGDK
ncbi:MAG: carboxypeptidase-like regulatory domain-containing protein [Bacteroidales bacterium]|nr:carboxypeptidase-like regulatory domain-containing protein [Bacteroidales bacterium]